MKVQHTLYTIGGYNMSLEERLNQACVKRISNEDMEEMAKNISEYWGTNCTDDEFTKNVKQNICTEIQHDFPESCGREKDFCVCCLVYDILNIIENKYL